MLFRLIAGMGQSVVVERKGRDSGSFGQLVQPAHSGKAVFHQPYQLRKALVYQVIPCFQELLRLVDIFTGQSPVLKRIQPPAVVFQMT